MKTLRLPFGLGGAGLGCAVGVACLVMLGLAGKADAQGYDATKVIPVTFYDFHSDRSNPEFEQPHVGKLRKGMVVDTLDLDGKPIAKLGAATDSVMNRGLRFWFRDWSKLSSYEMAKVQSGGHGYLDKFRPIYMYARKNGNTFDIAPPGIKESFYNGNGYNNYEGEFSRPFKWDRNDYGPGTVTVGEKRYSVDSAFTNRVIKGSITFTLIPNSAGVYEFKSNAFFPLSHPTGVPGTQVLWLNGVQSFPNNEAYTASLDASPRPFDNQWYSTDGGGDDKDKNTQHDKKNFAFTMELVTNFQYRKDDNLTFNFKGDDDVWLFIGEKGKTKKLVNNVDLGGVHEAAEGNISLNSFVSTYNFVEGREYDMHLFYCERHADNSTIRITTNIISSRPAKMELKVDGSNMKAGDPKDIKATVFADTSDVNPMTSFPGTFTWTSTDLGGYNSSTQLTTTWGNTNTTKNQAKVTAQKAYTTIKIKGCYQEGQLAPVCDSINVWVGPGDPDKVWIEANADSIVSGSNSTVRDSRPIGTITIDQTEFVENFYGIVRDKYGNWVSRAGTGAAAIWQGRSMKWPTTDPTVATAAVAPGAGDSERGRGRATRVTTETKDTWLKTNYTWASWNLKTDSARISVGKINYTEIRIIDKKTGLPITSGKIDMVVGGDTAVAAEVYDPVNKIWVPMEVTWGVTGVPGVSAPTGNTRDLSIKPTGETTGTGGTVTASYNGLTASVKINVVNKNPAITRIFSKRGAPDLTATIKSYLLPAGLPATAQGYVVPEDFVTVTAGAKLPLVSKLFTETTPSAASFLDISTQGIASRWVWSFVPGYPAGAAVAGTGSTLSATTGDSVMFTSTVAHQQYRVRVVYTEPNKPPVQQEIVISIVPDLTSPSLFIEREWQMTAANKNAPLKVDELAFAKGDTEKSVYAILRDQYNNYIAPSGAIIPSAWGVSPSIQSTDWSPKQLEAATKIVHAANGQPSNGEGNVIRNTGIDGPPVVITAKDNTFGKEATVTARILNYWYTDIQIVKKCDGKGGDEVVTGYCTIPGGEVTISTSQTEELFVVGQCSDNTCDGTNNKGWELVTADWDRDNGLTNALTSPPSGSRSWILKPNSTGKGQVFVTRNTPEGVLEDAITVTITAGAPTRAELVILTPEDDRIAGKPIQFEVKYFNGLGELREWNASWTNNGASFADILQGAGINITKKPEIVSYAGGNQALLYVGFDNNGNLINAKLEHNLATRKDVVNIIIYNATDNPHQIKYEETVEGNKLVATSERFTVKPGTPVSIKIEGDKVKNDTLRVLQSDPEQVLHAVAVDEWGNRIGDYPSDWNSGTPIPVDIKDRPVIVYVPGRAEDNDSGSLCIQTIVHNSNSAGNNIKLESCIYVVLTGVTARPISAVTKDYDGCGYLDRIDLTFKKPIKFADGSAGVVAKPGDGKITVKNTTPGFSWIVDSVTVDPANFKVFIWLNDVAPHSGAAQTGWTPIINIYNGLFDEAGAQTVTTTDGAPPVIATAKLYFPKESTGKITENYIDVTFSEKIRSSKGTAFGNSKGEANTEFVPEMLFNIWGQGGQNKARMARTRALSKKAGDAYDGKSFTLQDGRLAGIKKTVYIDESTLRFFLENEKEITPPNDYINIRTQDQVSNPANQTNIRDVPSNVPLANNRKVPITFGNEPGGNMKAIPNPASPDPNRVRDDGQKVGAGTIYATHDEGAIRDIRDGKAGGTVFEVPIYVPTQGKVKCQLKVYDLAGNLVNAGESNDAAVGISGDGGGFNKMHLYWNGYNSKKMKVAPGTYRMVVYISYENVSKNDENAKNKKFQGIVGIAK